MFYNNIMPNIVVTKKGKYLKEFPSDFTVIDIETTGLSALNDEIIEVSAIKVRDDKVVNKFSKLIKPNERISSFITNLTGNYNLISDIYQIFPYFISVSTSFSLSPSTVSPFLSLFFSFITPFKIIFFLAFFAMPFIARWLCVIARSG